MSGRVSCKSPQPSIGQIEIRSIVKRKFVGPSVIKLGRSGRGVVRHGRSVFEQPSIFQIGGDAGCPERMISDLCCDAGGRCASADHGMGVLLGRGTAREPASTGALACYGAE